MLNPRIGRARLFFSEIKRLFGLTVTSLKQIARDIVNDPWFGKTINFLSHLLMFTVLIRFFNMVAEAFTGQCEIGTGANTYDAVMRTFEKREIIYDDPKQLSFLISSSSEICRIMQDSFLFTGGRDALANEKLSLCGHLDYQKTRIYSEPFKYHQDEYMSVYNRNKENGALVAWAALLGMYAISKVYRSVRDGDFQQQPFFKKAVVGLFFLSTLLISAEALTGAVGLAAYYSFRNAARDACASACNDGFYEMQTVGGTNYTFRFAGTPTPLHHDICESEISLAAAGALTCAISAVGLVGAGMFGMWQRSQQRVERDRGVALAPTLRA